MQPDTPCTIELKYGEKPKFRGVFIETIYAGGKAYKHVWVKELNKEKWYQAEDVELRKRKVRKCQQKT